jgi:sugar phosphate isomerase/epimerase
MRPDQIAVQLYTLRAEIARDLPETLRKVSAAGYRAVELAGLPPIEPAELRDLLAGEQLSPMASHEGLDSLRTELGAVWERLSVVGCPLVIVPWLPEAERTTPADVRRLANELGEIARACMNRGIRLGYHNHAFEFAPLDGTTVWDVLLDTLPPEIELEVDVYWAAIGGRDPVEVIRSAGERVRLLHMKDIAAGPDRGDVAPGDGILPWQEIVAAGTGLDVAWYVVEEDNPKDPFAEVARGLTFLRGLAAGDEGG